MESNTAKEVAALARLAPKDLRERYAEVFGEATAATNRTWLVRRIAWRLQALAGGDLSKRARARATELARDADLCVVPPKRHADTVPARRARAHSRRTRATGACCRPAASSADPT